MATGRKRQYNISCFQAVATLTYKTNVRFLIRHQNAVFWRITSLRQATSSFWVRTQQKLRLKRNPDQPRHSRCGRTVLTAAIGGVRADVTAQSWITLWRHRLSAVRYGCWALAAAENIHSPLTDLPNPPTRTVAIGCATTAERRHHPISIGLLAVLAKRIMSWEKDEMRERKTLPCFANNYK